MLYDNALLLRVYLHWWRAQGSPLAQTRRGETADFLLRDLRTPEGGFASALDADTDGVEGSTYVWTPAQLVEVLGADDGAWAAELCVVTPGGTFEDGASTLQRPADPDDPARWERRARRCSTRGRSGPTVARRQGRRRLERLDHLGTRGSGSAAAGAGVGRRGEGSRCAAARPALSDGRLRRVSRDGTVGSAAGVLEDYGPSPAAG